MWITFSLFFALYFQHADAQTTESVTGVEGADVTLSCILSGTFTLPLWQGPPSLTTYTLQDAVNEAINPLAPAASRLQFASNKKDLILSNANINDTGDYKCSYTGFGDHIITLSVTAKHCKCECECKCGIFAGLSMAFGILGASGLLIAIGGICIECFDEMKKQKTLLLASCVIGIVCDVLGLVFSIVVKVIDCCEENCEDSECCKDDSECCKEDSKCCDDWIVNSAIAFIVIPCLAVVVSVVIFILVKLDKIGPGNNGNDGNATSTKSKKATSTRSRDATSTRSPKVQSQPEPQESLSSRANSDGEVSRKDVHVQEPKLRKLPMPPIQTSETHDKKGRGLSATFDDNHPLESVEIPERRAGDLEPMTEEPKKKKKRSKKAKETKVPDDDHEDKF